MFLVRCDTRCDEAMGFPSRLRTVVREAVASVAAGEQQPPRDAFTVGVDGEMLRIPYRLYYDPDLLCRATGNARATARLVLLCCGTRHYDGYLRQGCVRTLVTEGGEASWVVPYVIQPAGEYVADIARDILHGLAGRNPASLRAFALDNPAYLKTFERRVTSYWSCYYRQAYPEFHRYPGAQVLAMLRAAASRSE